MGKVILIAGIVFIALAVIEIIWFILRGITSGINQCHEWEENPDKKESEESGQQEALFSWAAYNMGRMPELEYMHHVPNGGKRDAATAIALKRQGVKAGVPDICLPAPRGIYHGLYIELKAGKNTTTAKQRSWLNYLRQQGYFTAVCYGWQTAAELVERYLLHTGQLGEPGQTFGKT